MYSPRVHPFVGKRGELDNYCLYFHHPSRRLELQTSLALIPISSYHSPELIDNMYFIGIHSTDSATASTFLIYLCIPHSRRELKIV
jgi:hypothetical protein